MAVLGRTIESLRREVALLVAERGAAAPVERALRKGLTRAHGNPLAYATRIVVDETTERLASIEAAKAQATGPPGEDPNLVAHRLTLEAIERMNHRDPAEDLAGTYPRLPH